MNLHADFTDIRRLENEIARAANGALSGAADALDRIVPRVAEEARANAASFPHGTGELARSVEYDTSGLTRRVHAPVRQAFFLEYGSPNTGAPRPWLTGPAESGQNELVRLIGEAGAPW